MFDPFSLNVISGVSGTIFQIEIYLDFPVFFICFRYNRVRPPNNENNCTANPSEEEFLQQVQNAQYF